MIYTPPDCKPLSEVVNSPQIRLGLQGPPGTGKTWASLTFPNPIVLNLDRGLGAHVGRADVIEIPFYNPVFVDKIHPRDGMNAPPNRKDAIMDWLARFGTKLGSEQTLIIDSNTQLDVSYHVQYSLNPVYTKQGKIDDFAEWKQKVAYFGLLMDMFKTLPCNVVYIAHETADRDKTGELNGMVRPLLTGQFGDQLASHFTDYFRSTTVAKPTADKIDDFKRAFSLDDVGAKEWIASTPPHSACMYLWQTQQDNIVKHIKTSTMVGAPKYVLANYNTFGKYKRKV